MINIGWYTKAEPRSLPHLEAFLAVRDQPHQVLLAAGNCTAPGIYAAFYHLGSSEASYIDLLYVYKAVLNGIGNAVLLLLYY